MSEADEDLREAVRPLVKTMVQVTDAQIKRRVKPLDLRIAELEIRVAELEAQVGERTAALDARIAQHQRDNHPWKPNGEGNMSSDDSQKRSLGDILRPDSGGDGTRSMLVCPVCGDGYLHVAHAHDVTHDREDQAVVSFRGECHHTFDITFITHERHTYTHISNISEDHYIDPDADRIDARPAIPTEQ